MRSVTTPTIESNTDSLALLSAVEDGDEARVRRLLSEGSRADALLRGGETPLMRAAARGHEDVARALLDANADVNARRADGFTPLVLAVFFGHEEIVKLLIERGADVHAQTRLGTTAESWAASRGFARVAELLRNAEAAPTRPFKDERVEIAANREAVKVADAETVKVADAETVKVADEVALKVENVKAADDVAKFSRAASKSDEAGELPSVSVRRDGHVPAHPSAGVFRVGGFLRSWQGSVGVALLLTALGVAVFAIWSGNRSRPENTQPAQAAPTPAPLTPAPDMSVAVTQPSPLPSPTPDAQSVLPASGVPPEALYPAPGSSAQPFYVPPAATNVPSVPTVISESGEPSAEDPARSRRRADAATNDSAGRTPSSDNRDDARADDPSRSGSTSRSPRVSESQPGPPPVVRPSPPPAATPERGKVIQWPPQ
jgi:hypothetical protein